MPIELDDIRSGYNLSKINSNFQRIEDAWDEKLDRLVNDQGNQMEQQLDMNSNKIINHPPTDLEEPTDLVRVDALNQFDDFTGVVPAVASYTGDGTTVAFPKPVNANDARTFQVYVGGLRQEPYADYQIVGDTVVFTQAPVLDVSVDIYGYSPTVIENGAPVYADPILANFIGDGTTTNYFVSAQGSGTESAFISIDGVNQVPNVDFTNAGGAISFTEAPPLNSEIFVRIFAPFSDTPGKYNKGFLTLSDAQSNIFLEDGEVFYTVEREVGLGGGSWWKVVPTSSVTPNGFEIVQSSIDTAISFVLIVNNKAVAEAFGAKGDLSSDDSVALRNMVEYCAVNSIKHIEMKRNYLVSTDVAVSPAGFGITFDERHNGVYVDCAGGSFVNNNTTSGTWSLLAISPASGDVENITIHEPHFIADAVMTQDDTQDNTDNTASGDFVNGITIRAVSPYRNRGCALTGKVRGYKLGNNTVNMDCAEDLSIDVIQSEECALHPIGARAVAYGAINTWPSDLMPSVDIKSIQGFNTRTLFDFSTVGDAKEDTGTNFATAHVHSVIGHNITGRTKVHGYWAFKLGSCSIKNDGWATNPNGSPGIDFTNPNYVDITCDAVRVENFSRAVRFENSNVQATIDTLEAINCLYGIQNYSSDVLINRYISFGTFGLYVNQNNAEYNFTCNSFIIENVRRQVFVDWLAANPTLWTGISAPTYPIIFGSLNGKMRWSNGVFRNCGEDSASVYNIFIWLANSNATQEASITLSNVDFKDPAPVLLNNIIQADGYQSVHLNNVNEKVAVATGRFYRDNLDNSRLYMSNSENTTIITDKFGGTLSKQGTYWTWVSSTDVLRISGVFPTDRETSGVAVGSQS